MTDREVKVRKPKRHERKDALAIIRQFSAVDAKTARHDIHNGQIYVAIQDGRVVGVTGIIKDDISTKVCWLGWTYVADKGKGIGSCLLRHVESLVSHRRKRLFITTSASRRYAGARKFYTARGYVLVGELPGFYADGSNLIIFAKKRKVPADD